MLDPAVIAMFVPVIGMMIPIVAILVRHQQRMAEIIHSGQATSGPLQAQIDTMRREIAELRQLVHQQTIALDTLSHRETRFERSQGATQFDTVSD